MSKLKVVKFGDEEGGREGWLNWRAPRATGSKIKKMIPRRKGVYIIDQEDLNVDVYSLIAGDWIGTAALLEDELNDENAMNRGTRLEPDAIARFIKETGLKAKWCNDDTGWERADDTRIAISPDAVIGKTAAVEVKCLSAKRHVQALITQRVPEDYEFQMLQYFVVNDSLKTLYFAFYDPRFPKGLDFFFFEIKRKDKKLEIAALLEAERQLLKVVRLKSAELTKYVAREVKEAVKKIEPVAKVVESAPKKSAKTSLERIAKGVRDRSIETGAV